MMRDVRESIHREMREGLANAWWSQVCDRAEDDGERHLPTFSHFLIVNKLLSLSLSLNKLLSLSLSLSGMAGHPVPTLRATSLSLQGDPAKIGKG